MSGRRRSPVRAVLAALLVASAIPVLCGGCSRRSGPERFALSGAVTHRGRPVPYGRILFAPDTARGNGGPGTVARIEQGRYRLSVPVGHVGGPHRLTITGYDGQAGPSPMGSALFPNHTLDVDLPRRNAEHDLDVPTAGR